MFPSLLRDNYFCRAIIMRCCGIYSKQFNIALQFNEEKAENCVNGKLYHMSVNVISYTPAS